jgi:hypothetical protein
VNGLDAYKLYVSIKQHFNISSNYNYTTYKGQTKNVNEDSYSRRKDKFYFESIARKKKGELLQFYVANFVVGDGQWIGDMYNQESESVYTGWKRIIESLTYLFTEDLKHVKDFLDERDLKFNDLFTITDGGHPIIFRFVEQKMIKVETYIIMDKVLNFSKQFEKEIEDEFIYPVIQYKFDRYAEFMNFNTKKYGTLMKQIFTEKT